MNLDRRFRGALLGLACGDALGTTLEFRPPGTFTPVTDIVGGGPFALAPGEWTDDTSMALCLAESLIECRGFDQVDQLERYVRWWREGHLSSNGTCFDIGNTVRAALARFEKSREPYCGSTDPHSAGNGSIMRLAPVPLFFATNPLEAIERSGESSQTTHGVSRPWSPVATSARPSPAPSTAPPKTSCCLLTTVRSRVTGSVVRSLEIASGSFRERKPPEIQGSGYVVRSLEAALRAFDTTDTFQDGCLAAVNLGDDADTTGAVYGQLAGAHYGDIGIPDSWKAKLAHRDLIESFANRLYELSSIASTR